MLRKLLCMKILFNEVVIKADRTDNDLFLSTGEKVFIDNRYEKGKHMVRTGTVVHTPQNLHFEYFDPLSLEYDTQMELQVGDKVIFHQLAINYVKKEPYGLGPDEYPIKYDSFFCAIRNGEIIPVNGNVIVEPLKNEIVSKLVDPKLSVNHGIVKYLGTPIKNYLMTPDGLWSDKGVDIKVGDHIMYGKADCVRLEFSLHQTIDKGTMLYRMRRKDIVAKL